MILTWSGGHHPAVTGLAIKALRTPGGTRGEITVGALRELHIGGLIAKLRPQPKAVAAMGAEADHYRAVAEVYRTAVEAGKPPVLAVANRFEITHPVARRWVHIARNRFGLLPPVRRGQTG